MIHPEAAAVHVALAGEKGWEQDGSGNEMNHENHDALGGVLEGTGPAQVDVDFAEDRDKMNHHDSFGMLVDAPAQVDVVAADSSGDEMNHEN